MKVSSLFSRARSIFVQYVIKDVLSNQFLFAEKTSTYCHSYSLIFIISNVTAQEIKFSIKDLVTFTEEILNGKLHFLYSMYFSANVFL